MKEMNDMKAKRLTKQQAAIISAYTGILTCKFSDMHKYIETIMGRPVFTHEMGDSETVNQIKAAAKKDFLSICPTTT